MSSSSPHRLPRTLLPSLYRLRLRPDLDKLTFAGSVSVDLKVASEGVDVVVLNALDVDVEAVSIRDQEGAEVGKNVLEDIGKVLQNFCFLSFPTGLLNLQA